MDARRACSIGFALLMVACYGGYAPPAEESAPAEEAEVPAAEEEVQPAEPDAPEEEVMPAEEEPPEPVKEQQPVEEQQPEPPPPQPQQPEPQPQPAQPQPPANDQPPQPEPPEASGPQPQAVTTSRGGTSPNALRGLAFTAGGGDGVTEPWCHTTQVNASDGPADATGWAPGAFEVPDGSTAIVTPTNGNYYLGGLSSLHQFVCVRGSVPPGGAVAISPDGRQLPPVMTQSDGLTGLRLPLSAYAQAGPWQLVVTDPASFTLTVIIPPASTPLMSMTPTGTEVIGMGFEPYEQIVIVLITRGASGQPEYRAFDVQADVEGVAYAVGVTDGRLIWPPIYLVGETGNIAGGGAANIALFEETLPPDQFFNLLYAAYWGGDPILDLGGAPGDCVSDLPPRLTPGQEAYVMAGPTVQVRDGPGLAYAVLEEWAGPYGFLVLEGPECVDNAAWWYVENYSGLQGWVPEGWGAKYFLTPNPPG